MNSSTETRRLRLHIRFCSRIATSQKMRVCLYLRLPFSMNSMLSCGMIAQKSHDFCEVQSDMQRKLMSDLIAWKGRARRKPLLLRGARQPGKTGLLKELGRIEFESVAYVDLLASARTREVFSNDFDVTRIVSALSVEAGVRIVPGETLLILDEVQEAPRALTSLKYFYQDMPELHVAAAGSYLGIAKHEGVSFPVGKVNILTLEPLTFLEFLDAVGEGVAAQALRKSGPTGIDPALAPKMEQLLKEYLFVGGMPEAVDAFAKEKNCAYAILVSSGFRTDAHRFYYNHGFNEDVKGFRKIY